MLYSLRGTVVHSDAAGLAVECCGVGYYCQASLSTLSRVAAVGEEILLYTYMHLRQDALDLFGFADRGELSCFKMLIGISGVGPKAALSILSVMTPERFAMCVASEDHKSITQAQGVGPKLAKRIVLECKDKVGAAGAAEGLAPGAPAVNLNLTGGNAGEAISALVVLGYSQADAATAVSRLDGDMPVEEMIKAGLKVLSGM